MYFRHSKQGYVRFFGAMVTELEARIEVMRRQRKNKKRVEKELLTEMESKVQGLKAKFRNVRTGKRFFENLNQYKNEFKLS